MDVSPPGKIHLGCVRHASTIASKGTPEVTVKVTYAVRYVPWFSRQYEEAKRFRFQRASNGHGYWAPAPLDLKWP